ncbi:MAG: alkyl hydroperoxide reductase [Blastocatellia bacterium]
MPPRNYPEIWQCAGMIAGVYGVGYGQAARAPLRHWPIVLAGLPGKICGPLGFLQVALSGTLPWRFVLNNITNDLIWWIPIALILRRADRAGRRQAGGHHE